VDVLSRGYYHVGSYVLQWNTTTMPRPWIAWISLSTSLLISLGVTVTGLHNGFHSLYFHQAERLCKLPAIAILAATAYVMAKSDRKALARQWALRVFGLLTAAACCIYWV
jgi:hypothetical protein